MIKKSEVTSAAGTRAIVDHLHLPLYRAFPARAILLTPYCQLTMPHTHTSPLPPRPMSPSLLDHLHASFLSGRASDVTLLVLHPWRASYNLHVVVLLQAGFFEMLFEGGWREALEGRGKVELRFEDPNITRAAFELCLSHLYHPTPLPFLPPAYLPTPDHPLTPSFPLPPAPSPIPRLLLSLLATASYLHIPNLITEASRLLLGSVSPWTVSRYLRFAIGLGLGEGEGEEEGVKGLGHAFPFPDPASASPSPTLSAQGSQASDSEDDLPSKSCVPSSPLSPASPMGETPRLTGYGTPSNLLGQTCVAWMCRWGGEIVLLEEQAFARSFPTSSNPTGSATSTSTPTLTTTIHIPSTSTSTPSTPFPPIWAHQGLPATWVRHLLSADEFWTTREEVGRWDLARRVVDLRREGWERQRVREGQEPREGETMGQRERESGRETERLREEEESEWETLFTEGIFYTHMPFDDLKTVSLSISPHTGRAYTPLKALQHAHWQASLLRSAVLGSQTHPVPNGKPGELGLVRVLDEIPLTQEHAEENAWFAVPLDDAQRIGDWNPAGVVAASVTGVAAPASGTGSKAKTGWDERQWFGIGNKRRSLNEVIASASPAAAGTIPPERCLGWTPYEPYRFSVEFFSAASLKLDKRPPSSSSTGISKIHSRTIFYAGSLFNVYIQVVKRKKEEKDVGSGPGQGEKEKDKETQLGVYVQRWSMVNPVPPASAPPAHARVQHRREESAASAHSLATSTPPQPPGSVPLHVAATWHPGAAGRAPTPSPIPFPRASTPRLGTSARASALSRSASPTPSMPGQTTPNGNQSPTAAFVFPSASPTTPTAAPTSYPPSAPVTPYRDPRQTLRAYFAVTCCSSIGTVLTRFSSAPDKFDVAQSWGWKSSCLREGAGEEGSEGALRVTVVLGLV
ncbi:hypothetical protein DACRYDRAFT_116957 [Dacryopinax primogenitus]|uniref:BTB domain-containing protein n=1 Tax=Dacryopinax primogenitus (strain DJM 731) TaxID=1858805 RepID=M5FXF6_DACPD|nr:uncharacterized protein DACRYDRAFT_116957 [Dacryopinax primogenitus]EJU01154.1 hypothetical protein DACRYDRAFT_116957 [Dacryopinax primogenitus]